MITTLGGGDHLFPAQPWRGTDGSVEVLIAALAAAGFPTQLLLSSTAETARRGRN
jgi:hypothetical protein